MPTLRLLKSVFTHRAGCGRSRTMGDPTCRLCRYFHAARLGVYKRNVRADKLKIKGHAYSDRLVAAKLSIRSAQ
jgi:hypothetical protein